MILPIPEIITIFVAEAGNGAPHNLKTNGYDNYQSLSES